MPKPRTQARSQVASRAALDLIDSRRMFYFYHVARLGSLTMAETYLDIAQPAITRQIKQFETDLGLDLLTRNGHGVKLTENGRIVYEQVELMLDQMAQTRARIEQMQPAAPLQVSVAASSSFTIAYMRQVVERFTTEQPGLRLQVREGPAGQVHDWLASRQVDLAVVVQAPNSQKLELQKLVDEPMVVVMSPTHALAGKKSVTVARLADEKFVSPALRNGTRQLIEVYFSNAGLKFMPAIEVDSLALTKTIIADSSFLTILPLAAVQREVHAKELAISYLTEPLFRTLYLAHLRDQPLSPSARALAAAINSTVRATPSETVAGNAAAGKAARTKAVPAKATAVKSIAAKSTAAKSTAAKSAPPSA